MTSHMHELIVKAQRAVSTLERANKLLYQNWCNIETCMVSQRAIIHGEESGRIADLLGQYPIHEKTRQLLRRIIESSYIDRSVLLGQVFAAQQHYIAQLRFATDYEVPLDDIEKDKVVGFWLAISALTTRLIELQEDVEFKVTATVPGFEDECSVRLDREEEMRANFANMFRAERTKMILVRAELTDAMAALNGSLNGDDVTPDTSASLREIRDRMKHQDAFVTLFSQPPRHELV
jgi:hypothetical protein